VLSPALIAAILVVGVLALPPTRRLFDAGRARETVGGYFLAMWGLGVLVVLGPARSRFFIPLLIVLYVLPFVSWRRGLARLFGRRPGGRPPPRNVTPQPRNVTPGAQDDARGTR
jgi:hypothetical protein